MARKRCSVDDCKKLAKKQWFNQGRDYCSRGCRNIGWIEQHCVVPEGLYVGKALKFDPFQRQFIRGVYNTPTRRAILSVGRKNAKTAISACIVLLHLAGPESVVNSELYSTARSRDQAARLFSLAAKIVRLSSELHHFIVPRDTIKQLYCAERGTTYQALSAEAGTAFGLSPVLTVHDELGQVRGPRLPLYEAMETATGAQGEPLSVVISTQAPGDNDLLSILIDDAAKGEDPRTKLFLWTADMDADPFDDDTIRQANPAFDTFQNQQEIRDMAEAARRMPAREAEFRNYILNQRVEAEDPFVTKSVWKANGKAPRHTGAPAYGGLDLSETNDLTSFTLVSPHQGELDVECWFWLPAEGIAERARQDRVEYDVWAEQGLIELTPGSSVEYEYVARRLREITSERRVKAIAFDRWNMKHLRPWLIKAGFTDATVENMFQDFGQGYQSMSPALRNLESLLLNARLRHGNHKVLNMCAANAVVKSDEAGSRKLDKKRSTGRIDGMVTLAMGASVASEFMRKSEIFPIDEDDILN